MRAGGCTVQQSLTAEAASVVKQAVTLARRRGHAQVTPLHVANTMLSASTGLLRTACLQSHSHPLQCKALELCFNVALNRLPASTSTPAAILGTSPHSHHHHHHHHQYPTISNALIAAFKRAQAHQRRGSIENQQQPLLAVKIELEQLIISILDDPSVSRVMREAGFSSTQVKSNIEQAVISLEMCSQSTTPSNKSKEISGSNTNNVLALSHNQSAPAVTKVVANKPRVSSSFDYPIRINNEDVMCVIENLMSKRKRNLVIVGECVASVEGVVRGVMDKIEKGDDDVPEALRDVKFIPFPLSSFRHMNRVEAEQKIEEMKILVRTTCSSGITGGGVVLNLGDLEWAESRASSSEQVRGYYCSIEHIIMELGKLVCGIGENKNGNNNARFWLIGVATFQTYMRCKSGHPSLESLWGLHPLTVPAGSLRLSLITTDSDLQSQFNTGRRGESRASLLLFEGGEESKQQQQQLACCADCSAKFEAEARSLKSSTSCNTSDSPTSSSLPAWLQQYKNEKATLSDINDRQDSGVRDLCKKWNSICNSTHKQPYYSERTLNFSSVSPSSSTYSGFSYDYQKHPNFHKTPHRDWSVAEPRHSWRENHFLFPSRDQSNNNQSTFDDHQPSFRLYIPEHSNQDLIKSSNPNSTPNSASSSDILMEMDYVPHNEFKELNSDNLTSLCNALEKKVPWQKDIVLDIASTVLKCRSGKMRRKGKANDQSEVIDKEETWMFFQGVDVGAKEKIAKELARDVFGSYDKFISIALSSFSSTRADSTDHHQDACRLNKRSRDEQSCSYIEKFAEAVSDNPHRVFLIEDVEQADYCSQKGFKRAIETGSITSTSNGDHDHEVSLGDAIIILSCESFSSRSRACSPPDKQKSDICDEEYKVSSLSMSLDLNISIDDESSEDDRSIDDIGLLDSVDKQIIFKSIE